MSGQPGQQPTKPLAVNPEGVRPGDDLLEQLDGRSLPARLYRERLGELYSDLGGEDALSYAQRSVARRAINMELWLQAVELRLMQGEDISLVLSPYMQGISTLLAIYRLLGLKRRPKEVPDLHDYLRQKGNVND